MRTDPLEVITVLGPIRPEAMGITQTHDHLYLDALDHYGGSSGSYDFVCDDEEMVIQDLKEFTRRGGRSMCDPTTEEIGRNPRALARIAKAAGINVLMGSGWYREFGYPRVVQEKTSRELAEILVREIEEGVEDTGIRAGFIGEIGTGRQYVRPAEERVFRAAALAQQRTGVAISTHTTRWGTLALEQIAMLGEFGADLSKVIIGHLGDKRADSRLFEIASRGVYVEVDNVGYLEYQPESVRADNVAALVKEGFGERVLLSQDIYSLRQLRYHGGRGHGYLLETFIPMLRERGLKDSDLQKLLVENPARAFARRAKHGR